MGTCVSSYGNTMGFSVSAQVAEKTTRKAVTLFHNLSYKINQLIHKYSNVIASGSAAISAKSNQFAEITTSNICSPRDDNNDDDRLIERRVLCLIT